MQYKFNAENAKVKELVAQLPTEEQNEKKARFYSLLAKMQLNEM